MTIMICLQARTISIACQARMFPYEYCDLSARTIYLGVWRLFCLPIPLRSQPGPGTGRLSETHLILLKS